MRICGKLWFIAILLLFTTFPLLADEIGKIGFNGAVFSGTSILNSKGSSYNTKMLPVIGISLFPYYTSGQIWRCGFELSFQHAFRSNYNDYYYYSSHQTISFIPYIEIHFLNLNTISGLFLVGLGASHIGSDYIKKNYFNISTGIGLNFKKTFIDSLFVSYNHSFLKDFYYFETIKIYVTVHIWDRTIKSRDAGEK